MPAFGETLEQALVAAYTTNPTLLAERAKLRATDEQVPQALANWRPTVTVTGDVGRSDVTARELLYVQNTVLSASSTLINSSEQMAVNISQPLYRGGRTVAQTRQAEATVEAERALLRSTEQTVLLNVITAYMNVVETKALLELAINNEQVLQRQLDAVLDRFHVGEVTRTDVAQAESRLSAAHADRTQAEGNLRSAVANYVNTVGHAPDQTVTPAVLPALPDNIDQAQDQAAAENPNILNARFSYEAAENGVDLIAGELLPTVSLNGTAYKYFNYAGPDTLEEAMQATINISVPIYQQGQEYSRLRAQKETAGQMRTTVDVTRRDTREAVTRAWEALQTARARMVSYADQIRAAKVALEGVQRESQVGSRTVLDVLNAEQELLNAQVNQVESQHDEIVATFQLLSAVGRLNARSLALPVESYDPMEHYGQVREKWIGVGESLPDAEQGK